LPGRCSHQRQSCSLPSAHGSHSIGRATNTAVQSSAATRLRCHSASAVGTAQTQWWDHDTGEASSIASAPRQAASTRSPRRHDPLATITTPAALPVTAEVLSVGLTAPAAAPAEVQAASATAPAGELPFTGSDGPATALVGALAVAGGWLLTRLGQTRRTT